MLVTPDRVLHVRAGSGQDRQSFHNPISFKRKLFTKEGGGVAGTPKYFPNCLLTLDSSFFLFNDYCFPLHHF